MNTTQPVTTPAPTRAEMRAAVETILRAWSPQTLATTNDGDDYDGDDTNGCGCGGEDDYGEPVCTCHDSCSCRSCNHQRHAETRRCHLRVPQDDQPYAWCGKPTRYRIKPFCVHRDGVSRVPSDGDPAATTNGYVVLGDSIQWHEHMYACSTQHARELIEQDRKRRAKSDPESPLSARNTFYDVEAYRYEPDGTDVPGALQWLRDACDSASTWAKATIAATFGTGRRGGWNDPTYTIDGCRASTARALLYLLDHEDELDRAAAERAEDLAIDIATEDD